MTFHDRMERLLRKIGEQCREIDKKSIERFLDALMDAGRVFVAGAGRSGLVARAFAMRLMHLGFTVYVVGESITPAIRKGDLLIAISGSGRTESITSIVRISRKKGAKIAALTSFPDSPVGKAANYIVRIKGRPVEELRRDYLARQLVGEHEPIAPLGTLFELSTMIFLDSVIEELMRRLKKGEEELREYHANLE